jgi:hypothetical protein
MDNAVTEHQPIRANHLGNGERRGNLHGGDTRLLQLGCDRSAAARARPSRGSKDDGVDTESFYLVGHLASHAARIR